MARVAPALTPPMPRPSAAFRGSGPGSRPSRSIAARPWFDADGTGARTLLATFAAPPSLTAADILVIA